MTQQKRQAGFRLGQALAWAAPLTIFLTACAGSTGNTAHDKSQAIAIPAEIPLVALDRHKVAENLENPRGLLLIDDQTLMVALAGQGQERDKGTSSIALLRDATGDGVFETRNEILGNRPSKNIIELVRRDEVFGMADIATGNNTVLATAAFFGGPSQIFEVSDGTASLWSTVKGNINDITYSEQSHSWIAVSSSSEQLLRVGPDGFVKEILKIPDLPQGQDPVPGYVHYEPSTGSVLVSLFSGSPLGEEGGDGTEILHGAGGIIRVDTSDGSFEWVVSNLTAPTDIALDGQGRLYVLEFCSDFLDPVTSRDAMWEGSSHGGFKRFSGRLLRIDLLSGHTEVLATQLDGPTNLHLTAGAVFVSQGMGTPGREIPTGGGTVQLDGFIEKFALSKSKLKSKPKK